MKYVYVAEVMLCQNVLIVCSLSSPKYLHEEQGDKQG